MEKGSEIGKFSWRINPKINPASVMFSMTSTVEIFHQRHCPLGNGNVLKPEKVTVDRVYI